ncbi:MAG TPA: hypothetical protein VHY09_08755 [Candidatus Methylacidiphilales bacterium]|jgi:hypothetical protein|nr:hypothetical protein [Candidatus Methylacidiphilales bacterium]
MSRRTISLKSRVRYEGRALTIDRRADLEVLPDPVWHTVGQVLRQNFHRIVRGQRGGNTTPAGR